MTAGRVPRPGLRVQIVVALAVVILVAYVPLFFAVAQLTRGTSLAYREDAARSLGRAVAAHVAESSGRGDDTALRRTLHAHVGEGGALAVAVFTADGTRVAAEGPAGDVAAIAAPPRPFGESATRVTGHAGRAVDVTIPAGSGAVVVRVSTDEAPGRTAQVVRGIGLYMAVFALALLVFAYIALTRSIVRPVEQLARAADKVALGSRAVDLPRTGPREIAELGASVRSMAERLLADERALRTKIEEISQTTKRLVETREQLAGSEHMASVGRLAAGVAHEIGNPIAAIMGMHDLLDDFELPSETRIDFLRRMRKETERINVVVRDLLDYARPETGAASGREAIASVKEVADDVVALVAPQKGWRSISLSLEVDDDLRVRISPQRLTQVLLNLVLNAGDATATDDSRPHRVTVRARTSAPGRARIEVEDDGPGVPAELRERIFDPFVTTKEVGSGTGLGLAVCRGIVEGAQGSITLDAGYEGGARFVVELPCVNPLPATSPEA